MDIPPKLSLKEPLLPTGSQQSAHQQDGPETGTPSNPKLPPDAPTRVTSKVVRSGLPEYGSMASSGGSSSSGVAPLKSSSQTPSPTEVRATDVKNKCVNEYARYRYITETHDGLLAKGCQRTEVEGLQTDHNRYGGVTAGGRIYVVNDDMIALAWIVETTTQRIWDKDGDDVLKTRMGIVFAKTPDEMAFGNLQDIRAHMVQLDGSRSVYRSKRGYHNCIDNKLTWEAISRCEPGAPLMLCRFVGGWKANEYRSYLDIGTVTANDDRGVHVQASSGAKLVFNKEDHAGNFSDGPEDYDYYCAIKNVLKVASSSPSITTPSSGQASSTSSMPSSMAPRGTRPEQRGFGGLLKSLFNTAGPRDGKAPVSGDAEKAERLRKNLGRTMTIVRDSSTVKGTLLGVNGSDKTFSILVADSDVETAKMLHGRDQRRMGDSGTSFTFPWDIVQ
jgi:hypothetical protein